MIIISDNLLKDEKLIPKKNSSSVKLEKHVEYILPDKELPVSKLNKKSLLNLEEEDEEDDTPKLIINEDPKVDIKDEFPRDEDSMPIHSKPPTIIKTSLIKSDENSEVKWMCYTISPADQSASTPEEVTESANNLEKPVKKTNYGNNSIICKRAPRTNLANKTKQERYLHQRKQNNEASSRYRARKKANLMKLKEQLDEETERHTKLSNTNLGLHKEVAILRELLLKYKA